MVNIKLFCFFSILWLVFLRRMLKVRRVVLFRFWRFVFVFFWKNFECGCVWFGREGDLFLGSWEWRWEEFKVV